MPAGRKDVETAFPPSHAEPVNPKDPRIWIHVDGEWRRGRIERWWRWDGQWAAFVAHEAPGRSDLVRMMYRYDEATIRPASAGRPE